MSEKNNESYMDYLNSKIVNKNNTMSENGVNDFNEARLLDEEGRYETIPVTINGCPGEISISPGEGETDHITWIDEKNTLFFISGHFDQETFIRMAESVKEKK